MVQVCVRPTRHNVDYAIGNPKRLVELFCCSYHLIKHLPRFAVMWGGKDKLLNLQSEEAPGQTQKIMTLHYIFFNKTKIEGEIKHAFQLLTL